MKMHLRKSLYILSCFLFIGVIFGGHAIAANSSPSQSNSVGLQATVPGNPPTVAATIATPSNGQIISSLPVKVSGLCTGDVLVKIFKNGVFAGSAQCINGSYSLVIDLFDGKNDLIARVYDALNQVGPDSATTTVTFNQGGFNNGAPRVTLTSDYAKRGANPKETITWPIILSGGTAPYAVSIDWGDSKVELKSIALAGAFDISHIYDAPGVYTVIVKVTDGSGNSAFLQLVAVGNGALTQDSQKVAPQVITKTVVLWWPAALALPLIVISFWLGSRSRLVYLRRQADNRIQY